MFKEVADLYHDLDDGMRPISVLFPCEPRGGRSLLCDVLTPQALSWQGLPLSRVVGDAMSLHVVGQRAAEPVPDGCLLPTPLPNPSRRPAHRVPPQA